MKIDSYRTEILEALRGPTGLTLETLETLLEVPPDGVLGDFAFPCFQLSKACRSAPASIAEEIKRELESTVTFQKIERIETKGPYVNFFINRRRYWNESIDEFLDGKGRLGVPDRGQGRPLIVEFSSPNIAKPFQISHLRSTNLGNALSKIYESLNYRVIRINHVGDWGTSFGKIIAAYKRWGSAEFVKGGPIDNLYRYYVRFHQEEDAELTAQAQEWSQKLEKGDSEALELWEWFRDLSLQEFKRIYSLLGVTFDHIQGESFYNSRMPKAVEALKEKGLLVKSENAQIVELSHHGLPPCLILKSDGTTLYITRDLAAALYRAETYHFDRMLYVVGSEQLLHFRQLFKVLELMGHPWAARCEHVPFGLIRFGDEKMSSRKGNVVLLEAVLNRAIELVEQIVRDKNGERENDEKFSDDEVKSIARNVGIGAIIFGDFKARRTKDVSFSWEEILNFDGETGPYLQYTFARLSSVIKKAEVGDIRAAETLREIKADKEEEQELLMALAKFPSAVVAAAELNEPSELARYGIELARAFNRFYYALRILKAEAADKHARLRISLATQVVFRELLRLLGIAALERM